jgi:adenosylhomocysteine nucleosidase
MCPYVPKHIKGNKVMRKNILIVSALDVETQGQLEDWKPHNLLITGVGKVNATHHLTKRLQVDGSINYDARINLVINYGTAGSRKVKKKTLVDCTKFIQRDMDVTGLGFMRGETPFEDKPPITIESISDFNPIGRKATCGSGDNFVEDRTQYYGEVVDMEAYALAKVCHIYNVPFISFKYITDGADEQAHEDWEANLADGIIEFKEKVLDKLPKYS